MHGEAQSAEAWEGVWVKAELHGPATSSVSVHLQPVRQSSFPFFLFGLFSGHTCHCNRSATTFLCVLL